MKPRPEDQEWFFFKAGSDAGLKAGPFSWERLRVLAKNGTLEQADVVWDPNSGWKTAAQVPGLYPAVTPPAATGAPVDSPPLGPPPEKPGHSRLYWLYGLAALVIVGAALGAYFGLRHDDGTATSKTTTTIPVATTQQAVTTTSIPVATTQSVTTTVTTATTTVTTATTAGGGTPVKSLAKKDSGNDVTLHVGDVVRVDLQPWKGDKLKGVWWDFRAGVIQKTGSDSQMVSGGVVSTWAEFQAVTPGRATIRAMYEYPDGTTASMWVIYLFVEQ